MIDRMASDRRPAARRRKPHGWGWRNLVLCGLVLGAAAAVAAAQEQITQADLLRRVIDLNRLTVPPPVGERTGMFSSYDRRSQVDSAGKLVEWDANDDCGQFLRHDDDGWDVLAEMNGPGAITRIWSANPDGNIRIVLDGAAVIEAPFAELLSGELTPLAAPLVSHGLNCYFPLGFNESCKVVCRESTACYQINFVQFPAGTEVQRFTRELDEKAQAALAEVKRAFEAGLSDRQLRGDRKTMPVAIQQDIQAGDTLSDTLDGAGTLRGLYVTLTDRSAPRDTYALHRCLLRIYVDGEKEPSVAAPLVDFFGSGFDLVPFRGLAIGTDKKLRIPLPERGTDAERGLTGFMYCHFPMPYRNGLRIEIHNLNTTKKPIGLLVYMQVEQAPPAEDALRFHAWFHKEDPCRVLDYPILRATGRGRLVGCVLDIDCPRAAWWGEGDEKIWIDGQKFPAYFGTGTADYLGHARGQPPFVSAMVGFTRASAYGKSSAYRWHIPDAINFQKSINFTLENLPEGGVQDTYYGSVVYWYAEPGGKHSFKPLTLADLTPPGLRIPGAVEVETNVITADWGNPVDERHYPGVEFSGQVAANFTTEAPVQIKIPCGTARRVRLWLRTNPGRSFGTITVKDSGGQTLGTLKYDRAAGGMYQVGVVQLEAGDNVVSVEFSRPAQLDCWIIEELAEDTPEPE